ncbi:MAG: glycosyltransferase family 2 protein [Lacipirellulaceae bacterium]
MDKSLCIILPIHNAERTLLRDVTEVLEAASELTSRAEVLIVDDGSHDDSFDVASEIAARYPQVRVVRRATAGGMGEAMREVRGRVAADVVVVHDGASAVNSEQLRMIWTQQTVLGALRGDESAGRGLSFADLRRPALTQPALEAAHRRLLGFQRATFEAQPVEVAASAVTPRRDAASKPEPTQKKGVGVIPPLPRANLFGVITDFARGE